MKTALHTRKIAALLLALLFILPISAALSRGGQTASANTASGSYVMSDLSKDENFDASKYPLDVTDYSLQVIQIAESTAGGLFVYVYQPSGAAAMLGATTIMIANTYNDELDLDFKSYKLTFLNSSGVFYKYKVNDYAIEDKEERLYNISSILRPYDVRFDDLDVGDNTINEVSFKVGQLWTVTDTEEGASYFREDIKVIEVKEKYVGYCDYIDGDQRFILAQNKDYTTSHFVAFSTEFKIENLLRATVQYQTCRHWKDYTRHSPFEDFTVTESVIYPEEEIYTANLKSEQVKSNPADGWKAKKHTWHEIESTEEFLKNENNADYVLVDSAKEAIKNTQWVLRFCESPAAMKYSENLAVQNYFYTRTVTANVVILRLEFKTGSAYYNLGVVDNVQTGGKDPSNRGKSDLEKFIDKIIDFLKNNPWVWAIVAVVALIVIVILCALLPPFFKFIKFVLKGLWLIISAPVRLIMLIVRKAKERKGAAPAKATSSKASKSARSSSKRRKT